MNIKLVSANEEKIKELENGSAFTWEGMILDTKSLDQMAHDFVNERLVTEDTKEIDGFVWNGKMMNEIYGLHGDNAYPDEFPFLCFDTDSFNGNGNVNVFKMMVGARWLDDIVANNAFKE